MCGINGAFFYDSPPDPAMLHQIISRCADRGEASCGVVSLRADHTFYQARVLGGPAGLPADFLPPDATIVINNNRAEPTTEWVEHKTLADVQPFQSGRIAVSHNGIIANDHELRARFALNPATSIDTAVLPPLIEQLGVRAALALVQGSLAVAIIDAAAGCLHLYRSFLPLTVAWSPGRYYFSSEAKNLPPHLLGDPFRAETLPPYSGVTIEGSGRLLRWT